MKLTSQIRAAPDLSVNDIAEMFDIYSHYYAGGSRDIFQEDLKSKTWVLLLYDVTNRLQGFSTLALFDNEYLGNPIKVLYSGDTIVNYHYWGQHELAAAWLRFAGHIKQQYFTSPLYWLLIVKGHRTYRYLSTFSHHYYPSPFVTTSEAVQNLINKLAYEKFGDAYNNGIVSFPESRGYLREQWAEIPEKMLQRPEVKFFLERNPYYYKGDELVCLCELSKENLKPYARRLFMSKM